MRKQDPCGQDQQKEAARILAQVEQDSQSFLLGGMPSHQTPPANPSIETDPAERWGRRIGRSLAVAAAIFIIIWFFVGVWR